MNRVQELRQLYEFHVWATERVLDAVSGLDEPDFDRDLAGSFPSIRATLVHMLSAEWVWLERWQGRSPGGVPEGWEALTLTALRQEWAGVEQNRQAMLEALTESELDRVVDYRDTRGTPYSSAVWEILRHVVNHSSHHRGQVTTMLRQLGTVPPGTDLIQWFRAVRPELTAG